MSIQESVAQLNQLVLDGKALEAFDRFYADDVVMQENDGPETVGKAANRQREEEFFSKITDFRGAAVEGVAFGDNTSMVQWSMDYTHADWGVRKYNQVAVQEWKDDKIVRERFFYGS